jgi:hypothetical protein
VNRIALIPIALLLYGCGVFHATRPYDSAIVGTRAKLTIAKSVLIAGVPDNPGGARFLLDVLVPDDKCTFEYKGSILLDPEQDPKARSRTIELPAGRAYFRVFISNPSIIKNVSFLLEENQEYMILYTYLGREGDNFKYQLSYVKTGASKPTPVDVDHWSICKREKGLPSD